MKYRVMIDERWYEVEIVNLNERPVRTLVDGESFEVWPEEEVGDSRSNLSSRVEVLPRIQEQQRPGGPNRSISSTRANGASSGASESPQKVLRAPIPGVIVSISVRPDDEVSAGQELFVLEAMKMKNSIRSNRAGKIASIGVSIGEHVQHNQVLAEYTG